MELFPFWWKSTPDSMHFRRRKSSQGLARTGSTRMATVVMCYNVSAHVATAVHSHRQPRSSWLLPSWRHGRDPNANSGRCASLTSCESHEKAASSCMWPGEASRGARTPEPERSSIRGPASESRIGIYGDAVKGKHAHCSAGNPNDIIRYCNCSGIPV